MTEADIGLTLAHSIQVIDLIVEIEGPGPQGSPLDFGVVHPFDEEPGVALFQGPQVNRVTDQKGIVHDLPPGAGHVSHKRNSVAPMDDTPGG
jgi:hypothetical protein